MWATEHCIKRCYRNVNDENNPQQTCQISAQTNIVVCSAKPKSLATHAARYPSFAAPHTAPHYSTVARKGLYTTPGVFQITLWCMYLVSSLSMLMVS